MNFTRDEKKRIEAQFDYFCKTILSNEKTDIERQQNRYSKYEKSIYELTLKEEKQLYIDDNYKVFNFELKILGEVINIQNENLYEALLLLPELKREIVIFKYFYHMLDKQISEQLKIPRTTINYMRNKSLKKLRVYLENMKNEKF